MVNGRPIFLNLFVLHYPIAAVVSFLHRLSGLFLVLMIPLLLWGLQESLASEARFEVLKLNLSHLWVRLLVWAVLAALCYHFFAGIRHLLMDIHLGESKIGSRMSAWIVLVLFFVSFALGGFWLWK
jgi:succinate dehydrogenase / fumarate reductase, cytochrome b subunit